jgi:hypothetical protein
MGRARPLQCKQIVFGDFWGNSDFEFSQEVNARKGTSHSGLQKTICKKFALELHGFLNETPRGDGLPICPPE